MIVAISRFEVDHGEADEDEIDEVLAKWPALMASNPAFVGMEIVGRRGDYFLISRWVDEASYQQWLEGAGHESAGKGVPQGVRVAPGGTEVTCGERLEMASSGGESGQLLVRDLIVLARLMEGGESIHRAVIDEAGRVVEANQAFAASLGGEIIGFYWEDALSSEGRRALRECLEEDGEGGEKTALVQVIDSNGEPFSLRVAARRLPRGYVVVGEPPWRDQRHLATQVVAMNAELAMLSRENARQARRLREAKEELDRAYWHLEKISEVLPICACCHAVKNEEGTWEDVATFLSDQSDFLSHTYCDRCAQKALEELDEGK